MEHIFTPIVKKLDSKKSDKKLFHQKSFHIQNLNRDNSISKFPTIDSKDDDFQILTVQSARKQKISSRNVDLQESFMKSTSKTKILAKQRMTPPLRRVIKS